MKNIRILIFTNIFIWFSVYLSHIDKISLAECIIISILAMIWQSINLKND